jgi:hypothetical protein
MSSADGRVFSPEPCSPARPGRDCLRAQRPSRTATPDRPTACGLGRPHACPVFSGRSRPDNTVAAFGDHRQSDPPAVFSGQRRPLSASAPDRPKRRNPRCANRFRRVARKQVSRVIPPESAAIHARHQDSPLRRPGHRFFPAISDSDKIQIMPKKRKKLAIVAGNRISYPIIRRALSTKPAGEHHRSEDTPAG